MKTIEEIEVAIQQLPPAQIGQLAQWFAAYEAGVWDQQLAEDARPGGKLDRLWEQAQHQIAAGESQSLDEFLDHA